MTSPTMRARYLNDAITTASPARLLIMLYERLVLDLAQAEAALGAGDREAASQRLLHAQDIVVELRASLKMDVWDGAAQLAQVYGFVLSELIAANIKGDADKVVQCRKLVEPLLDAWREAAMSTAQQGAAASAA